MTDNLYSTSKLYKYAIDYLSKFSSSKKNLEIILKNKIRRLKIEKKDKFLLYNTVNKIIIDLEKNNFIDDQNFTYSKIKTYVSQGKSRIFIQKYLFKKGVSQNIISENLDELDNLNHNWEFESAKIFARKKRISNLNDQQKNLSKFARAGFSYKISKRILENL